MGRFSPIRGLASRLASATGRRAASAERPALRASVVTQTPVYSPSGRRRGRIFDLSFDKRSGRIVCALVVLEGRLGLPERICPVPWSLLRYVSARGGYVAPMETSGLAAGPHITVEELRRVGVSEGAWQDRLAIYYNPYLGLPFT